jgi:hypothetical protein
MKEYFIIEPAWDTTGDEPGYRFAHCEREHAVALAQAWADERGDSIIGSVGVNDDGGYIEWKGHAFTVDPKEWTDGTHSHDA